MKKNSVLLKRLFIQSQAGDQASYRKLLEAILPIIEYRVRRKVFEVKDQSDVIQEVLLSIHKSLASYDSRFDVKPWVTAICERRIVDYIRKVSRRNNNEVLTDDGDVTNITCDAKSLLETRQDVEELRELMKDLPEDSQQAIRLTKLEGHSTKEAAQILGIKESALRTRISRSLSQLKDKAKKQVSDQDEEVIE